MKDYYSILGLSSDAGEQDIKNAYRRLAKKYHPDLNHNADSESDFIEINEAYEFLTNSARRRAYDSNRRNKINDEELKKREAVYRSWVEEQQKKARARATGYARASFDEFQNSPVYRTAMVVSRVYNYIFVAIGMIMAFGPLIWWLTVEPENPEEKKALWTVFFPMVLGLLFTYGIYVFLFKYNQDDD
jgi:hypothetical protein